MHKQKARQLSAAREILKNESSSSSGQDFFAVIYQIVYLISQNKLFYFLFSLISLTGIGFFGFLGFFENFLIIFYDLGFLAANQSSWVTLVYIFWISLEILIFLFVTLAIWSFFKKLINLKDPKWYKPLSLIFSNRLSKIPLIFAFTFFYSISTAFVLLFYPQDHLNLNLTYFSVILAAILTVYQVLKYFYIIYKYYFLLEKNFFKRFYPLFVYFSIPLVILLTSWLVNWVFSGNRFIEEGSPIFFYFAYLLYPTFLPVVSPELSLQEIFISDLYLFSAFTYSALLIQILFLIFLNYLESVLLIKKNVLEIISSAILFLQFFILIVVLDTIYFANFDSGKETAFFSTFYLVVLTAIIYRMVKYVLDMQVEEVKLREPYFSLAEVKTLSDLRPLFYSLNGTFITENQIYPYLKEIYEYLNKRICKAKVVYISEKEKNGGYTILKTLQKNNSMISDWLWFEEGDFKKCYKDGKLIESKCLQLIEAKFDDYFEQTKEEAGLSLGSFLYRFKRMHHTCLTVIICTQKPEILKVFQENIFQQETRYLDTNYIILFQGREEPKIVESLYLEGLLSGDDKVGLDFEYEDLLEVMENFVTKISDYCHISEQKLVEKSLDAFDKYRDEQINIVKIVKYGNKLYEEILSGKEDFTNSDLENILYDIINRKDFSRL